MLSMQGEEPERQDSGEEITPPESILPESDSSVEEAPISEAAMEPPFAVDDVEATPAEDDEVPAPVIEAAVGEIEDDSTDQTGQIPAVYVDDQPRTRLQELDDAIREFPNSPTNYVLRGELRLQRDDLVGAAADFQRGLTLALTQSATADWGFIYEAMIERAEAGLRRSQKR